ncbi:hypothetical protein BH20BAC1_BH20BAC1_20000 [soil metagenome]|jgi:hypothetical protein
MRKQSASKGSLLLAGLAAFAYYKYSKLSPEKKQDLTKTLKEKGQKLYDEYVPDELKKVFGKKDQTTVVSTAPDQKEEYVT